MARTFVTIEDSVILYDDQKLSHISQDFFDPACWPLSETVTGQAGRHGAVRFIGDADRQWVLRHYYRGGLIGKYLRDDYLWTGASTTRCVREWDLLSALVAERLPAPEPIAARYVRKGFWYKADLITVRIPDVRPLSTVQDAGGEPDLWRSVGWSIARFHSKGFCHADLNAHNIQVDEEANVWLLDWDRGARRTPGSWRRSNLERLKRSCEKLRDTEGFAFGAQDWAALLSGYREMLS